MSVCQRLRLRVPSWPLPLFGVNLVGGCFSIDLVPESVMLALSEPVELYLSALMNLVVTSQCVSVPLGVFGLAAWGLFLLIRAANAKPD